MGSKNGIQLRALQWLRRSESGCLALQNLNSNNLSIDRSVAEPAQRCLLPAKSHVGHRFQELQQFSCAQARLSYTIISRFLGISRHC